MPCLPECPYRPVYQWYDSQTQHLQIKVTYQNHVPMHHLLQLNGLQTLSSRRESLLALGNWLASLTS